MVNVKVADQFDESSSCVVVVELLWVGDVSSYYDQTRIIQEAQLLLS